MKIYYAHHIWKYNTPIEEYEINLIKEHYPSAKIVNPNGGLRHTRKHLKLSKMTEEKIMEICLEEVRRCDILVFSSMNGVVGKGVYDEVCAAQDCGLKIYYLHYNQLTEYTGNGFEIINESRRLYANVKLQ